MWQTSRTFDSPRCSRLNSLTTVCPSSWTKVKMWISGFWSKRIHSWPHTSGWLQHPTMPHSQRTGFTNRTTGQSKTLVPDWDIWKPNAYVFFLSDMLRSLWGLWIYRYEALLLLKRLNFQETGHYTLYVKSSMKNASITFDIKMYSKYSC